MRFLSHLLAVTAPLFLLSSCTQEEPDLRTCTSPTMDGHTYEVVRIGEQCWFAENLKTTEFTDGTPIPELTKEQLVDVDAPGRIVSPDLPEAYNTFYNGWTLLNPKGVCPEGWRVPTANEYSQLHQYTRSISTADWSNVTGAEFCDPTDWDFTLTDVEFNKFGFSAQPTGIIDPLAPASSLNLNADQSAWFWTRYWDVEHQGIVTVVPVVHIKEDRFFDACGGLDPAYGLCLRCILDE